MSQKTVAAYGTWSSPISAEMVARAGVRLSAPWLEDGVAWWLEGRAAEAGRVVLVRRDPDGKTVDVVPEGFNVRTSVHEYGGGAYCIHEGVAFVSNFDDQRLYRVDPGAEPVPITPEVVERRHRYADGRVTPDGTLWIGVRERHAESDSSQDVVNELVVLPTDGSGEPRVIVGGRDFYAAPRVSPDGARLCFLAWNLPWMPWDGCELHVADLTADGSVANVEHVAGEDGGSRSGSRSGASRGPRLRKRSEWLVEPRAHPRRRAHVASRGTGRVRVSSVGVGNELVRVPRRRPHRVRVRLRRLHPLCRPRPRDGGAREPRRRPRLVGIAVRVRRGQPRRPRRRSRNRADSGLADRRHGRCAGSAPEERRVAGRS